jgi:hypothetical protein
MFGYLLPDFTTTTFDYTSDHNHFDSNLQQLKKYILKLKTKTQTLVLTCKIQSVSYNFYFNFHLFIIMEIWVVLLTSLPKFII